MSRGGSQGKLREFCQVIWVSIRTLSASVKGAARQATVAVLQQLGPAGL